MDIETLLGERIKSLDLGKLKAQYETQNEALVIDAFLPQPVLDRLLRALAVVSPCVNRNYLPGRKKGGSVSRFDLDHYAPDFAALYNSSALTGFFRALTSNDLKFCPADDPHTYALYYYTEPGDHIGWHYDTSYYRGARYTVLFGLVDRSTCKLELELFHDHPTRKPELHSIALLPGTFVIFNGDKLWHRVTPLGENEERIVLTLEYLTNTEMSTVGRFVSNMKDAIAYFGFRQVFNRKRAAG